MEGRDQTLLEEEFGVGRGWPRAGPQDTVWVERWLIGRASSEPAACGGEHPGAWPYEASVSLWQAVPSCWL